MYSSLVTMCRVRWICGRWSGSVFTFRRFGKEWVYCGTRSCRLSRFSRRKRRSSCARKWSLNSSAGKRPNTNFHTLSQSTAAISPTQGQVHGFKNKIILVAVNQAAERIYMHESIFMLLEKEKHLCEHTPWLR